MEDEKAMGQTIRDIIIGAALSMPFWLTIAFLVLRYG